MFVATRPELAGASGRYCADGNFAEPRADADAPPLARKLWDAWEQIVRALG